MGADDYVTKPLSPRELTIDEARHEVTVRGEPVPLTPREFSLLITVAAQPGRVFTRAHLLERVWGAEYYDDHVVDVHVANLRHKVGDDAARPGLVQTVRGVGYRFSPPAPGRVPHV